MVFIGGPYPATSKSSIIADDHLEDLFGISVDAFALGQAGKKSAPAAKESACSG